MTPDELRQLEARYQRASRLAELLRIERNACIRLAITEGMTHAQVAKATGLTRGRIGQIDMAAHADANLSS